MAKRAMITGISGQDGSYLAEHLLGLGYEVWGLVRDPDRPVGARIAHLADEIPLVRGDLLDGESLVAAVERVRPDELYNLAAISFVPTPWRDVELMNDVNGAGVLRLLEAVRVVCGLEPGTAPAPGGIRFYQASSSEMFGAATQTPQHEATPFHPRSPYGVTKVYGHLLTRNYRESLGLYGVSGILFNHESPRRGTEFVTRKITLAAAEIKLGRRDRLRLGSLDARRDWGFAGDYVRAMHLMLQQDRPDDYVVGTGRTHTVEDVVRIAFETVGLHWHDHVAVDPGLVRPTETLPLCADPTRARTELGWRPSVEFADLIRMMVEADLRRLR
ncbi:GDP-mannose 4,6-dehydratase [Actinophytocola xanthii]|uniref:GDP-mannose 4,6-dehydratase n=1 Tax=Actinophytocola xanthii TaxID=1912961 RepID=A0A1Q8CS51_9PSEU|nr:GDP-mannose 4,6-dehydratase [Actinophytocola xanthii]OLF17192.1 GDP-mannose 4,6-dehydratase [Actinophytocola xanthii]